MLSSCYHGQQLTEWPPQTDHIQMVEKYSIQPGQMKRFFDNIVDKDQPSQEQSLCSWRGLPLAWSEAAHNSCDNIGRYLVHRVQVLQESSSSPLV